MRDRRVTLAQLVASLPPPVERRQQLWKLLAFVARYGRTSPAEARQMVLGELREFAEQIGALLEEEHAPSED